IRPLKEDLRIHGLGAEVALGPLEEADVADYLAGRFAGVPAELAGLVRRHCGGNPLFMVAIVDDLAGRGVVAERGGAWGLAEPLADVTPAVPPTLEAMLAVQLEQLDAGEQGLLQRASVVGERFSSWVLAGAGATRGAIEEACERLAERQQFIRAAGIHALPDG